MSVNQKDKVPSGGDAFGQPKWRLPIGFLLNRLRFRLMGLLPLFAG